MKTINEWVHNQRAEWSFRKLKGKIRPEDRVLNLGAGDCRLDLLLKNRIRCDVTSVDVENHNETSLNLTIYDGTHLPFPNQSFDVVLLLWVLHHADDPLAVLNEARRVARHIIVFEDRIESYFDGFIFKGFHRFLRWSQNFSLPNHKLTPFQWAQLAEKNGLETTWKGMLGHQLGPFASCTIGFVWSTNENLPIKK